MADAMVWEREYDNKQFSEKIAIVWPKGLEGFGELIVIINKRGLSPGEVILWVEKF